MSILTNVTKEIIIKNDSASKITEIIRGVGFTDKKLPYIKSDVVTLADSTVATTIPGSVAMTSGNGYKMSGSTAAKYLYFITDSTKAVDALGAITSPDLFYSSYNSATDVISDFSLLTGTLPSTDLVLGISNYYKAGVNSVTALSDNEFNLALTIDVVDRKLDNTIITISSTDKNITPSQFLLNVINSKTVKVVPIGFAKEDSNIKTWLTEANKAKLRVTFKGFADTNEALILYSGTASSTTNEYLHVKFGV